MAANNQPLPPPTPAAELMESILAPMFTRSNSSVVRPQIEANNFDINPFLINLVEKNPFGGEDYEDPHDFMDRFMRICDTTKHHGVSDDAIRLRLFPFALTRKTLRWLDRLAPNSIRTWDDLAAKFFAEHFSREKYNKLVNEITNFIQQSGETLYTSWARFQELIRKCPQYDFPDEKKVRVFYNGMTPKTRMVVNGAAGGTIGKKTAAETLELIDYMAQNDNASTEVHPVQPTQPKRGILQLGNNDASLAEQKMISQQLASLNAKLDRMQISSKVNVFNCEYCKEPHETNECTTFNGAEPFQGHHRIPKVTREIRMEAKGTIFKGGIKGADASIRNLESQIGQLSRQLAERAQRQFPGDTIVNPKADCKSIVTRSGIVITPKKKPKLVQHEKEEEAPTSEKEEPVRQDKIETKKEAVEAPKKLMDYSRFEKPLYPIQLKQQAQKQQYGRFLEMFKKLQINIPFAEALANMPNYKFPPKLQDPGSFNIAIAVGNTNVGRALCDLGASINLMPLSICKSLGITELKPTMVSLQLADRSLRRPNGIIQDVLVKVDKFIFPGDFIVLDMEEEGEMPLLLGRPFLATARAMIDVVMEKKSDYQELEKELQALDEACSRRRASNCL
ncbi:uncharacterized protein LOC133315155 [Gastrolobium bilobum]|uniref:uncharacterized protein LOC133315155 n=1 Tax=Gastrolobium bilobum TaxID=150636 RepID=UPI002AB12676|nr:uncharacterized protein LOC133315155 [Gastrolobium bilobum]